MSWQTFSFSQLILYFTLYSVIGWLCETIWCSVGARKAVNRGFLAGPWCPIYGFGALFILLFANPVKSNPVLVFLISMTAASALEYFTGWLMEALFQTRWWDYSGRRLNLKGRICLRNSSIFGLLGLIVTYFCQPGAEQFISILHPETQRVLASLLFALLMLDLIRTLASVTGLRERMENLKDVLDELDQYQQEYTWFDRSDPTGSIARLRGICENESTGEQSALILQRIDALREHRGSGFRVMDAFPGMRPKGLSSEHETLQQELVARQKARREEGRRWLHDLLDGIRQDIGVAYQGVTFTRMVWVFLIGCIAGYIVETAWCLLTTGVIESRQGMLYGPFSQIYGFGAVLMVLLLAPLSSKGNGCLFCGSAVVGGLFEVVCSLVQEAFFGSVSWQYSEQAFSLFGGRTSLMYIFFWGVLGTVYIRSIYPRILRLVERLPKRPKRFFTGVIAIGLSLNMLLSAIAVGRWADRMLGIEPRNRIEEVLDERYPNTVMGEIYPNMEFIYQSDDFE